MVTLFSFLQMIKQIRKLVQVHQHGSHIQVPVHDYGARRFVPTGDLNSSSRAIEFTVRNQERATVVHKEHREVDSYESDVVKKTIYEK